jgi:hypothetical protein
MKTKLKKKKGQRPKRTYGADTEKLTLTIPGKVKRMMDKYKENHHVNWSQIATEVFSAFIKGEKRHEKG